MSILVLFISLLLGAAGIYLKLHKPKEQIEYIWVGPGENPVKHMKH